MLIICEGPDLAGKTTFLNRLHEELQRFRPGDDVLRLHAGPPMSRTALDEYEVPLLPYRPGEGRHVLIDRWHWGEQVYPKLLGRKSITDHAQHLHIELFLRSRGALVIHVTAPAEILAERFRARGDELLDLSGIELARKAFYYTDAASILSTRLLVNTGITRHTSDYLRLYLQHAQSLAQEAQLLNEFVTYVGPNAPSVLLLGDVRGGSTDRHGALPAFMPYKRSSGFFLLDTLACFTNRELSRASIGIANANDVDDPQELWERLACPDAVALGHAAYKTTSEFTELAWHPQYARRFHHHDQQGYLNRLTRAARYGGAD